MLDLLAKLRQFLWVFQNDKAARLIIYAVLSITVCLIGYHIFLEFVEYFDFRRSVFYHEEFLITTDGGYPEIFSYFQLAVLASLMLLVFVRTRQAIYASLGAVFLLALAEDALEFHERVGLYLASIGLPAISHLGARHLGEVLHWLVIGSLAVGALVYGFVASGAEDRKIGAIFALLLLLLGFFAGFVDAIHAVLTRKFFAADALFNVLEDGAEMLMISLALCAAVLLFRHLEDLRRPPA